jgi:[NiFe] hydrogenase assembly HybE family chaperone
MMAEVQPRVNHLEQVFNQIAVTRMRGVPVLNPALRVQAIGFELIAEGDAQVFLGILITPWFMNLLRLPLLPESATSAHLPSGKRSYSCGGQVFDFLAAWEDGIGGFEACSLFSPMFEFADQSGAIATAMEVLKLLQKPSTPATFSVGAPAVPSRRGFLLGRPATGTAS